MKKVISSILILLIASICYSQDTFGPSNRLDDLVGDVNISSPADNNLLQYDNTSGTWKNETLSAVADDEYVNEDGDTMSGDLSMDSNKIYFDTDDYVVRSGDQTKFYVNNVLRMTLTTSSGVPDYYLMEDGTSYYLMEDGVSKYLME